MFPVFLCPVNMEIPAERLFENQLQNTYGSDLLDFFNEKVVNSVAAKYEPTFFDLIRSEDNYKNTPFRK
jgi:hypothetical protein